MEQSRIWRHFQTMSPESFSGATPRLAFLAGRLPAGGISANIGVGAGQLEKMAAAAGRRVVGIDPDPDSLKSALGGSAIGAIAGTIQALPLGDACLDAVVASEVLEHLDDSTLDAGLREVVRVLRPGGLFLGTVPFDEDLSASTVVCPHCGEVFHKVGHVRSFDAATLHRTLAHHFATVRVYRKAFMNTTHTHWRKRLLGWIRDRLVIAGLLTRETSLVFEARTRSR